MAKAKRTRCWLWKRGSGWVYIFIGPKKPILNRDDRVDREETRSLSDKDFWVDCYCKGAFKQFMPETYAKLTNQPKRFYMKFES